MYVFTITTEIASTYPEPKDKEAFISAQLYDYSYGNAVPNVYSWPKLWMMHLPYVASDTHMYTLTLP